MISLEERSLVLRNRLINIQEKKVLISSFKNTMQEKDLSVPANCNGYGRIHHFKLGNNSDWIYDPLPIVPACNKLKLEAKDKIRAQVFQVSGCNYRCWYCFVDTENLNGFSKNSKFFQCGELVDMYLNQEDPPKVIDLSGGQPDLIPEWTVWMMEALIDHGLENKVYLWSDDNLSTDFLFKYLNSEQILLLTTYKNYSKVCCFKGFNKDTFSLTTGLSQDYFEDQFQNFEKILELDIDLYAYITLTSPLSTNIEYELPKFMDRIQTLSENMLLRMIPLEIMIFGPVKKYINGKRNELIEGQYKAIKVWKSELTKRYSNSLINMSIDKIPI
ncbi:hypothetical protein [Maribellus maritimus]|uniref:hypothetical protein n=1 Tax=Maribellus maritimus TaxID=2870838 RepID=UPI001EE9E37D|nr:hypothetical protein [Maribellus maritimus]MCG6190201.1 hypothetical protein [Maribellus maritimus]